MVQIFSLIVPYARPFESLPKAQRKSASYLGDNLMRNYFDRVSPKDTSILQSNNHIAKFFRPYFPHLNHLSNESLVDIVECALGVMPRSLAVCMLYNVLFDHIKDQRFYGNPFYFQF